MASSQWNPFLTQQSGSNCPGFCCAPESIIPRPDASGPKTAVLVGRESVPGYYRLVNSNPCCENRLPDYQHPHSLLGMSSEELLGCGGAPAGNPVTSEITAAQAEAP